MITYLEPDSELYERERIVLKCIKNNPNLHHNALMKMIVPESMAKATFEKTRDSLLEKEIVSVQKKGNMKFYVPTLNYATRFQQHIERITNTSFHNIKNYIKKLETDYQHKDVNEKIVIVNSLLKNILQTDNGFTLLDSNKNPKKTLYRDEHLEIQQLIHRIFAIIHNDKDFDTIYPTVMSYLSTSMPRDYQKSE
ncbi:MAG: BlaI/MecI/CopY family transcriptional regulator [Nitrosarchaeum sp.]